MKFTGPVKWEINQRLWAKDFVVIAVSSADGEQIEFSYEGWEKGVRVDEKWLSHDGFVSYVGPVSIEENRYLTLYQSELARLRAARC